MKLAAKVKLRATAEQYRALAATLKRANECCDWISEQAWDTRTFGRVTLQKLVYTRVRAQFGLSAQAAIHAVRKVADAYRCHSHVRARFHPTGSISYDDRILSWHIADGFVSVWTIAGRQRISFIGGERQMEQLQSRQGQTDLVLQSGSFYLTATCDIDEAQPLAEPSGFLGVDLGVANIAADSDGKLYSGSAVKGVRHRQRRLRTKLQGKGTTSANRRLKKLAGGERRFATHTNHVISKQIVATAKGTGRGIAVEELTGIRGRVKVRHGQRVVLHSWAFLQLKLFVLYKAALAGVPVVQVGPHNSSRECSRCGHVDKLNRPSQSKFSCRACGFASHADLNAACVIAGRALVNAPHAAVA